MHCLNPNSLGDGAVDDAHPEALVCVPLGDGRLRRVAAEYVTIAQAWGGSHMDGAPAKLIGQVFDCMSAPNRFRLPAVYNLHVWSWKYNAHWRVPDAESARVARRLYGVVTSEPAVLPGSHAPGKLALLESICLRSVTHRRRAGTRR